MAVGLTKLLFLLSIYIQFGSTDDCIQFVHLQVQNRLSAVVRAVSDYYTDRLNSTSGLENIFQYIDESNFEGAIFSFPNGTIRRSFPNATSFRFQFPFLRQAFIFFEDDMALPTISCEGPGLLPSVVRTEGFIQVWITFFPYFITPSCSTSFPVVPPGCPSPYLIVGTLQHVLLKTKWIKTPILDYRLVKIEDILQKETPWTDGPLSSPYLP